ncbi:hypothetical protein ACWM35_22850 [Neobacillus sp. K501]
MKRKMTNYLKNKREVIKSFNANAKYMCSGDYVLDESIMYITKNDYYIKNRAKKILQTDYYPISIRLFIFLLRQTLFRKNIYIPEQDVHLEQFSGTIYRPIRSSNGYNDSKIFDLSHNKVLSIFSTEQAYRSVIEIYDFFKEYFPMPVILLKNDKRLLVMEELVHFQPVHTWMKEDYLYVMNDVFKRHFYYLKSYSNSIDLYRTPEAIVNSLENHHEIRYISDQIHPDLLPLNFPYIKLHGDLWTSNCLLIKGDNHQIKYIDWEYSNTLIFFYDIFTMMWLEVYMNNNDIYIAKYLKGEYDDVFNNLFSFFDMKFEEKLRLDYLNIYLLNFFYERLIHFDPEAKLAYLYQYKKLLDRMAYT